MKPNKCTVDYKSNTLTCGDSKVEIFTIESLRVKLAHANCLVNINPFSFETFWINWQDDKDIIISSTSKTKVAEMLTRPQAQGTCKNRIPVIVFNTTLIVKHVRKGDTIATISPAKKICSIDSKESCDKFIDQETLRAESINNINIGYPNKFGKPWKPSERIKFTNATLSYEQKQKIKNLIDDYWTVFSRDDEDIGMVDGRFGTHDIKLTNNTAIKQRAYKTPFAKEQIVNDSVNNC